jgi:hypothetical protein
MLLPTLSVTAIGVIAALISLIVNGEGLTRPMLLGFLGAWAGFVVGAFVGVIFDVVLQTGIYVAIVGHLMAVTGAVIALARFPGGCRRK